MAVKGNLRKLIDKLETKDAAMKIGSFVMNIAPLVNSSIQQRVQNEGRGVTKGLAKYKNTYSKYREKRGRQASYRDLTFTGKMWASLTSEKIGSNARLFFSGAEEAKKASWNNARDKFFGLSRAEKDLIKKELKKFSKI